MRINIRTRILLLFVGVAFIQALLLGSFFLSRQYQYQRSQITSQLQSINTVFASQIESDWTGILRELHVASQQVERMALKPYQQYNLLKNLQASNPSFAALAFYDINGMIQASVAEGKKNSLLKLFSNNELFETAFNSGNVFVKQIRDASSGNLLSISIPVTFLNNSYIIGVISGLIPCSIFQDIIEQTDVPSMFTVYLLDDRGTVIAGTKGHGEIPESFATKKEGNHKFTASNVFYFASSAALHLSDLTFNAITTVDKKTALTPSSTTLFLLLIPIIFILLLALFVGWETNKHIIGPLQDLAHSSESLLQGKAIEITRNGDAELQDVAHALETMNSQLVKSNKRLEQEIILRKRDEQLAIQAQIDAEKANQAKSIFLANMSHEIRTPLHAMINLLDMLNKETFDFKQGKLLSMATISGHRLQTLTDSILDFSLIESGKIELHSAVFSLSELLTEVIELMQVPAKDKNIHLNVYQAPAIHDTLQGDSGRLRQILINLINNGIKHTPKGDISLSVTLNQEKTVSKVDLLFSITDSGNGISPASRKKIFDPFEQGIREPGKITEGIGLGLAISKEFVQYMGGKIWLERSDENGSMFCFTICCEKGDVVLNGQENVSKRYQQSMDLSDIRILLAEDDFINQRIITAYLEEYGASVAVCENGALLLEKLRQENPDIILMDIRMPVLDGIETTKRIREKEAESDRSPVPIIALTAEASYDFEEKCLEIGMDGFLTKPIPLNELTLLIKKFHQERIQAAFSL